MLGSGKEAVASARGMRLCMAGGSERTHTEMRLEEQVEKTDTMPSLSLFSPDHFLLVEAPRVTGAVGYVGAQAARACCCVRRVGSQGTHNDVRRLGLRLG